MNPDLSERNAAAMLAVEMIRRMAILRCEQCGAALAPDSKRAMRSGDAPTRLVGRLAGVGCPACGAIVEPLYEDPMLRKLSQLARFGLSAGAGPILSTVRKSD